jgi:LysR family transcriptional regulator, benzoate and cis,cis-muconate-responsive activator of ben and cat genes
MLLWQRIMHVLHGLKGGGVDFRQLENFLAVCEEMGMGRAAERVHLSQPALSRQIQALESEIGVTLFDRGSKTIRLTPAGRHYEQQVRAVLDALRSGARGARAIAGGRQGEIRIGIFGSAILDFIPATLNRFATLHPDVRVALHALDKDAQIDMLRRRTLDIGFNRLVPEEADIRVELVRTEPLVLAMRRDHPLAALDEVELAGIFDVPLILYPSGVRSSLITRIHQVFAELGTTPLVAHEVPDLISALALVSAGFGVSLLPIAATRIQLRDVVFRRLAGDGAPQVDLACLYRHEDRNPLVRQMIACIRATAGDMPPPTLPSDAD